jgi:hypothetical protein
MTENFSTVPAEMIFTFSGGFAAYLLEVKNYAGKKNKSRSWRGGDAAAFHVCE